MDMHTHFLRDDTKIMGFVAQRAAVGKSGVESIASRQGADDRGTESSPTTSKKSTSTATPRLACITGAPSEIPADWFLTNEMKVERALKINKEAGTRRALAHAIFTPVTNG